MRKKLLLAVFAVFSAACSPSADLSNSPLAPSVLPDASDGGTVRAQSMGTLRVNICVNNDDSGYAWPSGNGVAHVTIDGGSTEYRGELPDVYGSCAYVNISLSAGPHTVTLVEDFYATHDLVASTIGPVTIVSGQTVEQGADFDDKSCHPSCP